MTTAPHTIGRPGAPRWIAPALLAVCALLSCRGGGEPLLEADAETVFVRGTTFVYEERAALEIPVGEIARFEAGGVKTATGVGVVVLLEGTGDTGEAFEKARAYVESVEGLRAPPDAKVEPGALALVMVEARIPTWLGRSAGLVGAMARPLGNAESLESGMLLETNLQEAGTGEVLAVAAGPVLISRVDAKGESFKTPKFGRVMNLAVKAVRRPGEVRILRASPAWPALLEALAGTVREAFPDVGAAVELPDRVRLTLPDDPLALPLDFLERVSALPLKAPAGDRPVILCDAGEELFVVVGGRLHFGRGTFLLDGGVRVASMAAPGSREVPGSQEDGANPADIALIEVTREGRTSKVVTLRWARQVLRVLDRLGVDYGGARKLLHMAVESGAVEASILDLVPGRGKFLKAGGGKVR